MSVSVRDSWFGVLRAVRLVLVVGCVIDHVGFLSAEPHPGCDAEEPGCGAEARPDSRGPGRDTKEKAFFDTYANPEVQANMVLDKPRTLAYKNAMVHPDNAGLFKGKVVLDVGCGTGVLSLFAAQAGAAAVLCVEYTPIAEVAREIVAINGFAGVVTVLRGKVEEVELPTDKVDIIVSEWMGYFGLFEGMFRSVLWARDRYLAPGGHMFPNQIELKVAAARPAGIDRTDKELRKWDKQMFGLDFSPLRSMLTGWREFKADQLELQWRSGSYPQIVPLRNLYPSLPGVQIKPEQLATEVATIETIDMQTVGLDALDRITAQIKLRILPGASEIDRVVGWFDAYFTRGGRRVVLETGPGAKPTHWHQMSFHFDPIPAAGPATAVDAVFRARLTLVTGAAAGFHREMVLSIDDYSARGTAVRPPHTYCFNLAREQVPLAVLQPSVIRQSDTVAVRPWANRLQAQSKVFTVVIVPDTSNWIK